MSAIKKVREHITANPQSEVSKIFSKLTIAIEEEREFSFKELRQLDDKSFALALDLLKDWHKDGYYGAKFKLLDLVSHISVS